MQIVLFQPEIPPNTGTIARLCAATKTKLHLIKPLGFSLEDKYLKRAGLDYWPHVDLTIWENWDAFTEKLPAQARLVCASARQGVSFHRFSFQADDFLVMGRETKGLPPEIKDAHPCVRIPIWGEVRSLNLANATTVLFYEAARQTGLLDAMEQNG